MNIIEVELDMLKKWRRNNISKLYRRDNAIYSSNNNCLFKDAVRMFRDMLDVNRFEQGIESEYAMYSIDELIERREECLDEMRESE